MAPEVRMKNCFLPSSQNHIDLCAGINAKGGKVPDTFSVSGFQVGCRKTNSTQQSFDGLHVWDKRRTPPQDVQKGQTSHPPNPGAPRRALPQARPQQAKGRGVLCSVRGASERSENAAGGLFQHPAKKYGLLPPDHHTYRLLHEQHPQFGTGSWCLLHTHDLIALSTGISTKREKVLDTVSSPPCLFLSGLAIEKTS